MQAINVKNNGEIKMAYNYSNDYGSYNTKKWADLLNQASNQASNQAANQTSNQASNETSNQTSNQTTGNQSTNEQTSSQSSNQTSNQTSNQADNCGNSMNNASQYSQAFTDFSGLDAIDQAKFQQNRQAQKNTPPDQV
jgi:hypothetical protein